MYCGNELVVRGRGRKRENRNQNVASELAAFAGRFLVLSEPATIILPVWALHTYVFDKFEFTPYLNIVSPEPGCGKTTTADVLSAICCRATSPTCGTAAVLRRKIDADKPTLILDEWDSLDRAVRDACKNFLNSGFRKDGKYSHMEGGKMVEMTTFCPKAIVGRSTVKLAEATLTRCIPFTIHKATGDDNLEKFRDSHRTEAETLRQRCEEWAQGFRNKKVLVSPHFPESLDGRQRDISEPLLVIADVLGDQWPHRVREALVTLFASRQQLELTPENHLLRALQKYIRDQHLKEAVLSQDFCVWANAQEEQPWSERSLTTAKLAGMLRTYDISPHQINRLQNGKQKNCRGYLLNHFDDVFRRYIGPTAAEC